MRLARRAQDARIEPNRCFDERKQSDLARCFETRPRRLTVLAAGRVALGRRERELIELFVERVDEDLVELLAIHRFSQFRPSCLRLKAVSARRARTPRTPRYRLAAARA